MALLELTDAFFMLLTSRERGDMAPGLVGGGGGGGGGT